MNDLDTAIRAELEHLAPVDDDTERVLASLLAEHDQVLSGSVAGADTDATTAVVSQQVPGFGSWLPRVLAGPVAAVVAFVAVLAVGAVWLVLRPGATTFEASPANWPEFELTFVAGDGAEQGRVLWHSDESWRVEWTTDRDASDPIVRFAQETDQVGLRDFASQSVLQVILATSEGPIFAGAGRPPDADGVPLAVFIEAGAPTDVLERYGSTGNVRTVPTTHPLAAIAAVTETDDGELTMEFTVEGIPVKVTSADPEGPTFEAISLVRRSVNVEEVLSPHDTVRRYTESLAMLTDGRQAEILADGAVSFDEYSEASQSFHDCLAERLPSGAYANIPVYDPYQGYALTASGEGPGVEDIMDSCHDETIAYVAEAWGLQILDTAAVTGLALEPPTADEIAIAQASPEAAVTVESGPDWEFEAYRQGPGVCFDITIGLHGAYGCLHPEDWQQPIHLIPLLDANPPAVFGTVTKDAATVTLTYADGHHDELRPIEVGNNFPVAFLATLVTSDHGSPDTAIAYDTAGNEIARTTITPATHK